MTIFGLFIFILMLVGGGIALDLMRAEVNRTELQYTVDRAVLAAGSLDNTRDGREIVQDYLRAAGYPEDAVRVISENNGFNSRIAVASEVETQSLFMNMLGVDTIITPVSSEAKEEQTEIEIALVLDRSGSMGGSKLTNLKTAANAFVTKLLKDRELVTTISVVPYNHVVNLGEDLASKFDLTGEHASSNCVIFDGTEYSSTGIAAGTVLQRLAHFDPWTDDDDGNATGLVARPQCQASDEGRILPWSNDVVALTTHINSLTAHSNTAMDLGVKWGLALLDPTLREEASSMIADGDVPSIFTGRPYDHRTPGVRKVMVVMTDGKNTQQYDLKDAQRVGGSGIFAYNPDWAIPSDSTLWPVAGETNDCGIGASGHAFGHGRGGDTFYTYGYNDAGTCEKDPDATPPTLPYAGLVFGRNKNGEPRPYPAKSFDKNLGSDTILSIWSPTNNSYMVRRNGYYDEYRSTPYGGSEAVEIDNSDLYSLISTDYIYARLTNGMPWSDRQTYRYAYENVANATVADNNLSAACKAARDAGIIIYTIAVSAPSAGEDAMRDCAGDDYAGNYFDVNGLDPTSAFDEIFTSMNRLRLTQ
ncbi:pilus assembly protein TadG-related protein [Jannaschia sp. KMU-145]|uniref:pilus assembly protein TadG-related protein n=1 Tax=Jannaschia halovivens TaxID=3388667 RepID=UPI00396B0FCD